MAPVNAEKYAGAVARSPEILGGVPVFAGTRVPVKTLWDYLTAGDSLDQFLEDFPTVSRTQALQVLRVAGEQFLEGIND
jgi:uncharacterized protein (DUF433 family)